jgi:hypothetical protein
VIALARRLATLAGSGGRLPSERHLQRHAEDENVSTGSDARLGGNVHLHGGLTTSAHESVVHEYLDQWDERIILPAHSLCYDKAIEHGNGKHHLTIASA